MKSRTVINNLIKKKASLSRTRRECEGEDRDEIFFKKERKTSFKLFKAVGQAVSQQHIARWLSAPWADIISKAAGSPWGAGIQVGREHGTTDALTEGEMM